MIAGVETQSMLSSNGAKSASKHSLVVNGLAPGEWRFMAPAERV